MPNVIDFVESAISNTNALFELVKRFGHPDLGLQISDLKLALSSVKVAVSDLNNENRELKEELRLLKFDKENPLVFREEDGLYYNDDKSRRPYCPMCYEVKRLRVHLTFHFNPNVPMVNCPHCGKDFPKPGK
jgi:hypothetical protein